jgi:hypothetical protein
MHLDDSLVRERAYTLWLEDGAVDGRADHYWLKAERELLAAVVTAPTQAAGAGRVKKTPRKPVAPRKRAAGRGTPASPLN